MNSSSSNARRTRKSATPGAEVLEGRQMMTGGVGSTFAIIPATITKAGGTASVSFALDPKLFKDTGNKPFVLGLDIAPNSSSSVNPKIVSVTTPTGQTIAATHATFDPKVTRSGVQASSSQSSAVLVTIPGLPSAKAKSFTYKVNVAAVGKTSGAVLVGFYLPGDANGTGKIDQSSLNAISYAMGTNANDTTGKYSFDADTNRNGQITAQDLAIAKQDLGFSTTVSPVISANLGSAGIVDATNRVVNTPTVTVTGAASPGATVVYSEASGGTATATADTTGNYSIQLPLVPGSNVYNVTATDGFKQKITGSIAAITYTPGATVPTVTTSAPVTTTTTTSTSTTATPTSTTATPTTATPTPTTTTTTAAPMIPASTTTTPGA